MKGLGCSFFFGCFLLQKHNGLVCRHKILVVLVFTMVIHGVISQVVSLQQVAITQHSSMMRALLFFLEFVDMPPRVRSIWRYEKVVGYMKNQLFGSFFKKMIRQYTRLIFDTFHALIRVVGPSLEQKNTNMRESILVKARVAMVLARLNNEFFLQMREEVYGIAESMTSIMVKEFCVPIKKHLKPLVIPKLTKNKIKDFTIGFE